MTQKKPHQFKESLISISGAIGEFVLFEEGYEIQYSLDNIRMQFDIVKENKKQFSFQITLHEGKQHCIFRMYPEGRTRYFQDFENFIIDQIDNERGYNEESFIYEEEAEQTPGNLIYDWFYGNIFYLFSFEQSLENEIKNEIEILSLTQEEDHDIILYNINTSTIENEYQQEENNCSFIPHIKASMKIYHDIDFSSQKNEFYKKAQKILNHAKAS